MTAKTIWFEKYRPQRLADYVFHDAGQQAQIERWVTDKDIPHLLLCGVQGSGKTSLAKVLVNELGIDDMDYMVINASDKNGIDFIRDNILAFAESWPMGKFKVVHLEECLHEDTLVSVLRNGTPCKLPINSLNSDTDLVKSFNIELNRVEWKPFTLHDKGVQDLIELVLSNGETVICTADHKWFVQDVTGETIVVKTTELTDHILSIKR